MLFRLRSQQATTDNASDTCKSMIASQVDANMTKLFEKHISKFKMQKEDREGLHIMTQDIIVMDTKLFRTIHSTLYSAGYHNITKLMAEQLTDSDKEIEDNLKQEPDEGTTRMDA